MSLFSDVTDFANLHRAYLNARALKRYRTSILRFGCHLEENLARLRWELMTKRYVHGSYRTFAVTDSKRRVIKAAPFRDRVVHHAVCNVIEPILDRTFICDSYACRKGKGTHAAVKRLICYIHTLNRGRQHRHLPRIYGLKCDVSRFFESIDGPLLLNIVRKKIHDDDLLWLLRTIIESNVRGIPIGNLTSQLFANAYLNELDHFVKRVLKERYYLRYMDDFVILGTDKEHLRAVREEVRAFLNDHLKLSLHPKKAGIAPVDKGVDFLGYVIHGKLLHLRKSTVKRFLKKKRRYEAMVRRGRMTEQSLEDACTAWRGYARFADSYRLMTKLGLNEKKPHPSPLNEPVAHYDGKK